MAKYRYEFSDRLDNSDASTLTLAIDNSIMTDTKMKEHLLFLAVGEDLISIANGNIQDAFMTMLADYIFQSLQRNPYPRNPCKIVEDAEGLGFVMDGSAGIFIEKFVTFDPEPTLQRKTQIQDEVAISHVKFY